MFHAHDSLVAFFCEMCEDVPVMNLAGAWLLIQLLETLFPIFGLPATSIQVVVVILAIGFVLAVILAWVFQITPEGRKSGASGPSPRLSRCLR